ncbi:MAG: fibronectin type III domain-containing protein [Flavobacteriales bacterium]
MSIFKTYLVKLGLTGLTSSALVEKGRNIVTMLTGNPTYPTLQGEMADTTKACDDLDAANQEMLFNGGKIASENKRELESALRIRITGLGQQVQVISGGDKAKILSAGFEVRKNAEPITKLEQPQDLRCALTGFKGLVDLDWEVVHGARYYNVWFTAGDPNTAEWQFVGSTTKSRYTMENLTPGTTYTFRVNAVGARAESPLSDISSIMAA